MIRRIAIILGGVVLLGLLVLIGFAWRPSIPAISRPTAGSFSADSIARGESLAAVGHCASCHTSPAGQQFAGGYGVNTPYGIIYGTNITPDPEIGIGNWSLAAFTRAMREGVSRDGHHLFPAFPYWAFTKLSDDDMDSLYAYMMTRPPARATVPHNTIPFPLSIRPFQAGWKLLFFRNERFQRNPSKSDEWNRGAYLAEALSDCGGCHTPRNLLGGERATSTYAGAVIDGWIAPALTEANPSPVPWTQEELFTYLRTGTSPLHGATGATMTPVIRGALDLPVVPDSDVRAIAIYFRDMNHVSAHAAGIQETTLVALATSYRGVGQEYDPDADLYTSACISCHYNAGQAPLPARPELALNSAITLAEPTNFIQVVLNGISSKDGAPGLVMPPYASSLTDSEIARLAAYLRRTRTNLAPWTDLEKKVADIRKKSASGF